MIEAVGLGEGGGEKGPTEEFGPIKYPQNLIPPLNQFYRLKFSF